MRGTTTAGLLGVLLLFPATWPIGLAAAEDPENSGVEEHGLDGPDTMDDGEDLMDDGSSLADMQKELEADDSSDPKSDLPSECIQKAENMEASISLFDQKGMGKDKIRAIADGMKHIADHLFGEKSKGDFADKFHEKLEDVHSKSESFGAHDACKAMMEHHSHVEL
mmetsp:Transcript_9710/g.18713  ORF Transcript_9710/g.18713 Transcript_9710/m.18713 type:complete len:166 (-) Transcript_9710:9-506(-)